MTTTWQSTVARKRSEREALMPAEYKLPESSLPALDASSVVDFGLDALTERERAIVTQDDVDELLGQIAAGTYSATEVLEAYIKRTVQAHQLLNPVTEVHFADARRWAGELDAHFASTGRTVGPLHGLPISLKDQFRLAGTDATIGYVSYVGNAGGESVLVRLLRSCGAVPYVKTNVPQTLMYAETSNEVWGVTSNPHNRLLHAGGSSGGEGALVSFRGSPVGVGTDVGGSVRIPAALCGVFGLRPSQHRLPYEGAVNTLVGQETVPSVLGPLARSVGALATFTRAVLEQQPWLYDPLTPEMPWRQHMFDAARAKHKLSVGIMWHDGLVRPFPAYTRALATLKATLEAQGHSVTDFPAFDTPTALAILADAFNADGGQDVLNAIKASGEPLGPNVTGVGKKQLGAHDTWLINDRKNTFRKAFLDNWVQAGVDCILAPTSAYTALEHGSELYISYTGIVSTRPPSPQHRLKLMKLSALTRGDTPYYIVLYCSSTSSITQWSYSPSPRRTRHSIPNHRPPRRSSATWTDSGTTSTTRTCTTAAPSASRSSRVGTPKKLCSATPPRSGTHSPSRSNSDSNGMK